MSDVPYLAAFIAGFVSTLVFHQGIATLLWLSGAFPRTPYDLHPSAPLGVPAVISLAFWGGLWGMVLWTMVRHGTGGAYWLRALIAGALLPTVVSFFIVSPLKGLPVAGGWDPRIVGGVLMINATWGLGVALLMRSMVRTTAGTR